MPLSYEEEKLKSTEKKHHSTESALLKVKNDIFMEYGRVESDLVGYLRSQRSF